MNKIKINFLKFSLAILIMVFCSSCIIAELIEKYRSPRKIVVQSPPKPSGKVFKNYEDYLQVENEIPNMAYSHALISGPTSVDMPLGRILLLRQGKSLCALKFTYLETEPVFSLRSDGEREFITYIDYEWYYTENRDRNFFGKGLLVGEGSLKIDKRIERPVPLLSMLIDSPSNNYFEGNHFLKCGPMRIPTLWAGITNMDSKGEALHEDLEFVPTKWRDLSEVEPLHPGLSWYGPKIMDQKVEYYELIPLEDLPPKKSSIHLTAGQ